MRLNTHHFTLCSFIFSACALSACAVPPNQYLTTEIIKNNPGPLQISFQKTYSNLNYPVGMLHANDGSNRTFVVQQSGQIIAFQAKSRKVFLDISKKLSCCGESGLLGLAFHPNFKDNGLFFINYLDKKVILSSPDMQQIQATAMHYQTPRSSFSRSTNRSTFITGGN